MKKTNPIADKQEKDVVFRVLRGGSWRSTARGARSSNRNYRYDPLFSSSTIGFRLVRNK